MSNKNTLLITADSVRADFCGFLDGPNTTPFLSELAADSEVYHKAISPGPRTPSSIAPSLTGRRFRRYPSDSNEGRLERIADHVSRYQTLPEMFSECGYTTAAVTANPWTTTTTGFNTLFDQFIEIGSGYGEDNSDGENIFQTALEYFGQWRKKTDWFAQWTGFYNDIEKLIDELSEPWFLWVFLLDTHSPYIVPQKFQHESNKFTNPYSALRYNSKVVRSGAVSTLPTHLDQWLRESYRDAIRSVDGFAKQIYEYTDDDTAFIFHSDHGEAFGEHGTYGHQEQLYPENVHVPLLVHNGETASSIREPVSTLSLPDLTLSAASSQEQFEDVTSDYIFSETEFGDQHAIITPSTHVVLNKDETRVFKCSNGKSEEIKVPKDIEALFEALIDAEFAEQEEMNRIVRAVEQASIADGLGCQDNQYRRE